MNDLPESTEIDITSMATVALILVVIFISSGSYWVQPAMDVELPEASTAESERKQNLTVSINANGDVAIDDVAMTWETLYDGIVLGVQANRDKFVLIRADRKAYYGELVEIMGMAKDAGANSISIATEQKDRGSGG